MSLEPAPTLPVLMYHHVSPSPGLVTVSPECFRSQMAWLAARGWHSVGGDDLASFFAGEPLARKSVLITFDDGYLDNYVHAYPVLRELGLKAMLFLVTGWIGDGAPRATAGDGAPLPPSPDHRACKQAVRGGMADQVIVRWSEVERMAADGVFEFHSHTHAHRRWDLELPDPTERRVALAEDLAESRRTLQHKLGKASEHLCWPQGYYAADYLPLAADVGFGYFYTTERRMNYPVGDRWRIGRMAVKEASPRWLERRLTWFATPWLGELYARLKPA